MQRRIYINSKGIRMQTAIFIVRIYMSRTFHARTYIYIYAT